MHYHQIDTFPVSKDEWDTKEDTGKSMKNALHLSEGISQLLSQLLSQSVTRKFHLIFFSISYSSNLLKVLQANLKASFYLTNTASLLSGNSKLGF